MEENISKKDLKDIIDDLYNEFNEERIRLKVVSEDNIKRIEEIEHYIFELSKSSESDFSIFSPRSTKVDHTEKIEQLKEEQKSIKTENESILHKLEYYEEKVQKLQGLYSNEESVVDKQDCIEDVSILLLQEMEKQRISRDLHDSTVQNMTHLVHQSELCMKYMDTDPIRAKLELESIHKGIKDLINETRTIIFNLRPMSFDDIGFQGAIEHLVEVLQKSTDIKIVCHIEGNYDNIDDVILLSIIRIVQEASNNAIKHSEAKEIAITIAIVKNQISVEISDNGRGIQTRKHSKEEGLSGFGISIMEERTKVLKGSFHIATKNREGTKISILIPITMKGEA